MFVAEISRSLDWSISVIVVIVVVIVVVCSVAVVVWIFAFTGTRVVPLLLAQRLDSAICISGDGDTA